MWEKQEREGKKCTVFLKRNRWINEIQQKYYFLFQFHFFRRFVYWSDDKMRNKLLLGVFLYGIFFPQNVQPEMMALAKRRIHIEKYTFLQAILKLSVLFPSLALPICLHIVPWTNEMLFLLLSSWFLDIKLERRRKTTEEGKKTQIFWFRFVALIANLYSFGKKNTSKQNARRESRATRWKKLSFVRFYGVCSWQWYKAECSVCLFFSSIQHEDWCWDDRLLLHLLSLRHRRQSRSTE